MSDINIHSGKRYERLVIQNGMLIDGRGTPAEGPVDIVIEHNIIKDIIPVDPVSLSARIEKIPSWRHPEGENIIDASGMYIMPGLVDNHTHVPIDDERCGPRGFEYAYKLWLAHGVTTIRTMGHGEETLIEHRRLSEENKIIAPRIIIYHMWPYHKSYTPEEASELVRKYINFGVDGVKASHMAANISLDILDAICKEAKKQELKGVAVHLTCRSGVNAVAASNVGVNSIEHWYGIPQAALPGTQSFPPEYNELNEVDRFRWAGRLWKEAECYPEKIIETLDILIKNGTIWVPTMTVYEANRDIDRAKSLPWYERYLVSSLKKFWSPSLGHHASYHFNWKTSDEVAWKENFIIWMKYVKIFFDHGGILTAGSDAGYLYSLYGFSLIRELELLQEAGIHPLDIIKIATTNATKFLGLEKLAKGVWEGGVADLAIVDGNPLDNFKIMYGTGIQSYSTDEGKVVPRGGVRWTIKDGIVFDTKSLLRDVEDYVRKMKEEKG